jgi:nucleoid-associated protein YgaU
MPVGRGLVVVTAALVTAPWLWRTVTQVGRAADAGAPVRADEALTAVVAAAALAGLLWVVLGVLLGLLVLVPGCVGRGAGRVVEVVTPVVVRRAVGALLGVGLAAAVAPGGAVAAPSRVLVTAPAPLPDPGFVPLPDPAWAPAAISTAGAATATASPSRDAATPATTSTSGRSAPGAAAVPAPSTAWVAPPPLVRAQPDVRLLSPAPRPGGSTERVAVRRGDSLWSIAARHLGRDASDAEIARAWPAWFDANRDVIGDDPDLLRPGQLLRPPEGGRP